jgi:hypothetical protein
MKGSNAHSRIASKDYGVAQSFTLTWNGQKTCCQLYLKCGGSSAGIVKSISATLARGAC